MKPNRNIHIKPAEILSVCVDGTTELRLMLTDDKGWILVEECAISTGIDSSRYAKREISRNLIEADDDYGIPY